MIRFLSIVARTPALVVLGLIRFYQKCISPALGPRCRFYPSCSEYAFLCIERRGLMIGGARTAVRLCKCHPWHPGGVDFPDAHSSPDGSKQYPTTLRKKIRAQ